ncbi:MAG: alpha/beta fold hydrolase [Porticoccaceae bacterium]
MAQRDERHQLPGPAGIIEACWENAESGSGRWPQPLVAVIAHPHPLYGGAMDNKVVTTLARMYRRLGVAAVRFNFRGVGGSAGGHDQGRGEVEDMLAVVRWAQARAPESALLLAGYSFGSALAAAASERVAARHLVLVAPPVDRYPYAPQGDFACPTAIVLGGADEIVAVDAVAAWARQRPRVTEVIVLPEASHFFHGQLVALERELGAAVSAVLSADPS